MSYDKDRDILKMYKYKCMDCTVKFLDAPSLILHYKMMHNKIMRGLSKDRRDSIFKVLNPHNKLAEKVGF